MENRRMRIIPTAFQTDAKGNAVYSIPGQPCKFVLVDPADPSGEGRLLVSHITKATPKKEAEYHLRCRNHGKCPVRAQVSFSAVEKVLSEVGPGVREITVERNQEKHSCILSIEPGVDLEGSYLVECSMEGEQKAGGIFSVVASKMGRMMKTYGQNYLLLAPCTCPLYELGREPKGRKLPEGVCPYHTSTIWEERDCSDDSILFETLNEFGDRFRINYSVDAYGEAAKNYVVGRWNPQEAEVGWFPLLQNDLPVDQQNIFQQPEQMELRTKQFLAAEKGEKFTFGPRVILLRCNTALYSDDQKEEMLKELEQAFLDANLNMNVFATMRKNMKEDPEYDYHLRIALFNYLAKNFLSMLNQKVRASKAAKPIMMLLQGCQHSQILLRMHANSEQKENIPSVLVAHSTTLSEYILNTLNNSPLVYEFAIEIEQDYRNIERVFTQREKRPVVYEYLQQIERFAVNAATRFLCVGPVCAVEMTCVYGRLPTIVNNGVDSGALQKLAAEHRQKCRKSVDDFIRGMFIGTPMVSFKGRKNPAPKIFKLVLGSRYALRIKGVEQLVLALKWLNAHLKSNTNDVYVVVFLVLQKYKEDKGTGPTMNDLLREKLDMYEGLISGCDSDSAHAKNLLISQQDDVSQQLIDLFQNKLGRSEEEALYVCEGRNEFYSDLNQNLFNQPVHCATHQSPDSKDEKLNLDMRDPMLRLLYNNDLINDDGTYKDDQRVFPVFHPYFVHPGIIKGIGTIQELMLGCDLSLAPSQYETWGLIACESMALFVPSITTSITGFGRHVLGPKDKNRSAKIEAWKRRGLCIIDNGSFEFDRNGQPSYEKPEGDNDTALKLLHDLQFYICTDEGQNVLDNAQNLLREARILDKIDWDEPYPALVQEIAGAYQEAQQGTPESSGLGGRS